MMLQISMCPLKVLLRDQTYSIDYWHCVQVNVCKFNIYNKTFVCVDPAE